MSPPLPDPTMMNVVQTDRGAVKFVLSGANIMCPGLTSPGARMEVDIPEGTPVVRIMSISMQKKDKELN